MIDFTETIVLPEDELAKRRTVASADERDDVAATAFDDTLVLEDELANRRRPRSLSER